MSSRTKNAVVTLAVGLALNISLGVAKLVVGLLSDSTSVMSDAFNNLSDAAVSIVTIIATALAARAADHEHPFGHGRYEYIAAFVLGAVIFAVGIEVFTNGIERAIEPVPVDSGAMVWATLGTAIGVKAFMAVFYTVRGRISGAETIKAAAIDSASDAAVTSAVLVCAIIERFTGAHIDGYAAIAVAVVIIVLALRILKNTASRLLGERPSPELESKVRDIILAAPHVVSVHDLVINDYGEAKKIAEADAVFPAELAFLEVHAVCDGIEREVFEKTGVSLSIHADPLITDDPRLDEIGARLDALLKGYDATAHDLAIDDCRKVVCLDIMPPDGAPVEHIKAQAEAEIKAVLPYGVEIRIDYV